MPTPIQFTEDCDKQFKETLKSYLKDKNAPAFIGAGRIRCSRTVSENSFEFSETVKLHLFAENPVSHFEAMYAQKSIEGVPILTIAADCSLIYKENLSQSIAEYLHQQAYLAEDTFKSYQIVLQESLSNAVEYGCLGMAGLKDETINNDDWFEKYHAIINERLNNPEYAQKQILIHCTLHGEHIVTYVEDAGEGFKASNKKVTKSHKPVLPHGMGRAIITEFADGHHYEKEGKCLVFKFKAPFIHSHLDIGQGRVSLQDMRKNAKILIVDDQISNREFAKAYLKSAGYDTLLEASSGEEAIQKTEAEIPDLIILDIVMPGISGFTVCRKIKQSEKLRHIPILFLSGLDDSESKIKGYRIGAVDYVSKPIDRSELIARVDTHVQSGNMIRALKEYSSRTRDDLTRASAIQNKLLPSTQDLDIVRHKYDLDIEHIYQACDELAGDYWTLIDLSGNEIAIAMADFTGHGVVAALDTIRLHALFKEMTDELRDPMGFIRKLNDKLYDQTSPETFVTFMYGVLNTQTGMFKYVGCGAPSIAVLPKEGKGDPTLLDCSGLPLGLVPTSSYEAEDRCAFIAEGDSMLIYSDALIETPHGPNKEMWLDDGLLETLKDIQEKHAMPTLDDLTKRFNRTAHFPLKDDLTLLKITRAAVRSEDDLMAQLTGQQT